MMKAGVAALDITPPLGTGLRGYFEERRATMIHDPLFARAFALESGGEGIAVVVCDLIGVRRAYLDRARDRIATTIGLAPERVLICCTHTHTGPETGDDPYTAWLVDRIADAVAVAWRRREPVEVGWARATEDRIVFNRRFRMRDGTVQTNPGVGNPEVVEPAGPIDPEVGVLALRRGDGSTLGALANYSLHYVGIPEDREAISADYFGFFSQILQRIRGESFVAALSNGACGDINNIDVLGGTRARYDRYQHTERVATRVAAAAVWAWNEASFTSEAPIGAAMTEVVLKRRSEPDEAEHRRAEEIEARVATGGRVTMGDRAFAARVLRRWEVTPPEVPTWVQALRIGDLALVAVPGELLVELGLEIKRRSPFGQTMVMELANDSVGYLPTRRAFEEGAYEPEACPYTIGCGEQIVEAAVTLLERLHSSRA